VPAGSDSDAALLDSVDPTAWVSLLLAQVTPDVVTAMPMLAIFAKLLLAAIRSVDVPVALLNLKDAEHAFDLATARVANRREIPRSGVLICLLHAIVPVSLGRGSRHPRAQRSPSAFFASPRHFFLD